MKTYLAGLQASTQTSYSNNGKTTMLGRAFQKTINSQQVIGPTLTNFIDTFTLTGITPSNSFYNPITKRLFILSTASATPTVLLYNFDPSTSVSGVLPYSYVGKVLLTLANSAATTHSFRGFKVDDSVSTAIKIFISSTGSVVVNGGTYMANGLSLSDFTGGGTTLWAAIASNQKAVYFLQDQNSMGPLHVATTSWGIALPILSGNSAINTKVYQLNNTAPSANTAA